jgi:molybdenum cofactor cytidylyltransferase
LNAGIVLAAGAARRFGAPKQLAELAGVPLLQHAVDAMVAVPALERVVVVLGAAAAEVSAAVRFRRAEPVVCREWEEGMAASLRCGVAAVGDAAWVVVTLGDQPGITAEVIAAVLAECRPGRDAVRAAYAGRPGHPVALSRSLLSEVAALRGDVGARELLERATVRSVEALHLGRPDDVDTPEQLEAMRA